MASQHPKKSSKKAPVKKVNDIDRAEKDFFGGREDHAEGRSVSSRERIRGALSSEMEMFLAKGGSVQEVAPHVTADPPQKPGGGYGSKPI